MPQISRALAELPVTATFTFHVDAKVVENSREIFICNFDIGTGLWKHEQ